MGTEREGLCAAGLNPPLLAGNIISNGMSLIVIIALTYIFPDKTPFQWEAFKERITTTDDTVCSPHSTFSTHLFMCACLPQEYPEYDSHEFPAEALLF